MAFASVQNRVPPTMILDMSLKAAFRVQHLLDILLAEKKENLKCLW